MRLTASARFKRAYEKLPDDVKPRVDEALSKFLDDPRRPGLHFEKLGGSAYRTIRPVRGAWRIVLLGGGSEYELVDVDTHKIQRLIYFRRGEHRHDHQRHLPAGRSNPSEQRWRR
jgi:hypothetical protein